MLRTAIFYFINEKGIEDNYDRDLDLNSTSSLKCFQEPLHNPDHTQTLVGLVGSALRTVRPEQEESREECGSVNE